MITHWLGRIKVGERALDADEIEALRNGFSARFRSARIRRVGRTIALALGALSLAAVVFLGWTEPDLVHAKRLPWVLAPYAIGCVVVASTLVCTDERNDVRGIVILAFMLAIARLALGPNAMPEELTLLAAVVLLFFVPLLTSTVWERDNKHQARRLEIERDIEAGVVHVFALPSHVHATYAGRHGLEYRTRQVELLPESVTVFSLDGRALRVPRVTSRVIRTVHRADLTNRGDDEVSIDANDGVSITERPMRSDERVATRQAFLRDMFAVVIMSAAALMTLVWLMITLSRELPRGIGAGANCLLLALLVVLVARTRRVRLGRDLFRGRVRVHRGQEHGELLLEVLPHSNVVLADRGVPVPARWHNA